MLFLYVCSFSKVILPMKECYCKFISIMIVLIRVKSKENYFREFENFRSVILS